MEQNITITNCDKVDNFDDVLLMPSLTANVRSVNYALGCREDSVTFTQNDAIYTSPSGERVTIISRNSLDLYSVIPGRMSAVSQPICIAGCSSAGKARINPPDSSIDLEYLSLGQLTLDDLPILQAGHVVNSARSLVVRDPQR